MRIRLTFFILFGSLSAFGQARLSNKVTKAVYQLNWQTPGISKISDSETMHYLNFVGAQYSFYDDFLPRFYGNVPIKPFDRAITVTLVNTAFEPLSDAEVALLRNPSKIPSQIEVKASIALQKKQAQGVITFLPIRKSPQTGKFEKLISFDVEVVSGTTKQETRAIHTYAAHSVLQNGIWHKLSISAEGVYKISYSFLQGLGYDMSTLNPANIRIYGNGGGMLPALNSDPHPDDLMEDAILVNDGGDGSFDSNDYVLFYGKGPNTWQYNLASCPSFTHTTHLFSDSAYYFITTDLGLGKRISTQVSSGLPVTHTVTTFDDYAYHENDVVNFIKSGNQWFGEYFDNISSYNFSFSFPNIDASIPVQVKTNIASRYLGVSLTANYLVSSGSGSTNISIGSTAGDSYNPYAIIQSGCFSFNPSASSTITINVTKQTTNAVAWLDYIEVNARRNLTMSGNQMLFRDMNSVGSGNIAEFNLMNLTPSIPVQVWDITDPTNIYLQAMATVGTLNQFQIASDTLHQFISFNGNSYFTPKASGLVANQDLHALAQTNFLIITHPDFYDEALQLAQYHYDKDTLTYVVVTPQQIYNEFSSGAQDLIGIRDFVKMFYDRASTIDEMPQYLLLFGDGSYDNKNRFGASNTNFIPTYQSLQSTVYTESYVSDDYYGLLDDTEGTFPPDTFLGTEAVDIGIGRFPVKTKTEAQSALNKIFKYTKTDVPYSTENNGCTNNTLSSPFGDWRNTLCFIGDDEDGGLHEGRTGQGADQLATMIDTAYNDYNIDKIYLDAYKQVSTPGGNRYPDVVEAINKRIEKGCLIMNYTGHGGEVGLAHERIVEVAQINNWNNINNMPLVFTATCEFSRYDDPERTSAGEYVFLNPNGGGIALFTTVRLVFASPNFYLNQYFYQYAFNPMSNGKMPRLGDCYAYMKARPYGYTVNGRNFTLLGDPALTLEYPKYDVVTDTINNIAVSTSSSDTIKALSLVTVKGHLNDNSGNLLSTYNGVLYPTVYDKAQSITTLSNDGLTASPPFTFKLQKNILYKGKVSVTNGYYSFSFVVPKDIAYAYGVGRISYYAYGRINSSNETVDANGYYEKIIIGGSNDTAVADNAGPEVNLYMNDKKFVFGGLTDENPDLFAVLKDANGVNTVGNGIGHDITAIIDANTDGAIVLNDYYQADLNSYKSGTIRYPFTDLSEGKHTLTLKVWDVYNNSSQVYTEFNVAKSEDLALNHVLNYPNPFTTKTQFYFEQNRCCQNLEVQLQIFTVSGKLVKNIAKFVQAEGYRSDPIEWDGKDDFGDKIGRGVYIYKLKVKTEDGSVAEKYEKLVILN